VEERCGRWTRMCVMVGDSEESKTPALHHKTVSHPRKTSNFTPNKPWRLCTDSTMQVPHCCTMMGGARRSTVCEDYTLCNCDVEGQSKDSRGTVDRQSNKEVDRLAEPPTQTLLVVGASTTCRQGTPRVSARCPTLSAAATVKNRSPSSGLHPGTLQLTGTKENTAALAKHNLNWQLNARPVALPSR
jgi:hypothetical protein